VTDATPHDAGAPGLRADAARNRAQVLDAARAAFRELGTAAPLDEIARRAGVNIATLYRRFPDREALITQVVVDGLTVVLHAARRALESAPDDAPAAIEGFMLSIVDARDTLALPLVGGPVTDDPQAAALQQRIVALLDRLLATAHAQGAVRVDATAADLIAAGAMACRPTPYLPAAQSAALAHRHVRIFLDGLRPAAAQSTLPPSPTPDEIFAHLRSGEPG
jgi:AcrR family transcriptional regulator